MWGRQLSSARDTGLSLPRARELLHGKCKSPRLQSLQFGKRVFSAWFPRACPGPVARPGESTPTVEASALRRAAGPGGKAGLSLWAGAVSAGLGLGCPQRSCPCSPWAGPAPVSAPSHEPRGRGETLPGPAPEVPGSHRPGRTCVRVPLDELLGHVTPPPQPAGACAFGAAAATLPRSLCLLGALSGASPSLRPGRSGPLSHTRGQRARVGGPGAVGVFTTVTPDPRAGHPQIPTQQEGVESSKILFSRVGQEGGSPKVGALGSGKRARGGGAEAPCPESLASGKTRVQGGRSAAPHGVTSALRIPSELFRLH